MIVGPSGSGKGTLINALQTAFPDKFAFSVSYTTRGIRTNEVDGIHYNFVTKDTFETMKAKDEFLETAAVHGNYYGTAKVGITKIQEKQKIPLLDIDVQGAVNFVKYFPNANCIFLASPSLQHMRDRLQKRGTETDETIETRLKNAVGEVDYLLGWKEKINYRIFNDDLETS